ncbi:MAG: ABC transporter permease [Dehalococcoidales bacterium]
MRTLRRSLLNIIRSPSRSVVVLVILAVSLGLALVMFEVHAASASQLSKISGNVGNTITVRPAGTSGFGGGGGGGEDSTPLPQAQVDQLSSLPHVTAVQETVSTSYTGSELVSGISFGSFGSSFGNATPVQVPNGTSTGGTTRFGAITVMGVSPTDTAPALAGGGTMTIESGAYFTADDTDADVAVVGQTLATANNLSVGSEITIGTDQVQVIGIYTTGEQFGDNMIVMPVGTVQNLYNINGATSITVTADNAADVNIVANELRGIWDSTVADVVTAQQEFSAISGSITSANSSSQTGMIISFVVAAVVVLASVILVIRQRIREIGIMKAIGASNGQIGFQFGLETTVITVVATVFGIILSLLFGQQIANLFTSSNSGTTRTFAGGSGFTGRGTAVFGGGGGRIFAGSIGGIHVAVSPEVVIIAFVSAIILAIAASVIPVWYIARVRPAEVLRNE